jgi:hypothetical protein
MPREADRRPLSRTQTAALLRAVVLFLAPLLLWQGYCWGWWLQSSSFMQRLFQCSCPPASEAARYPAFVVIASACQKPFRLSVSHDYQRLIYREEVPNGRVMVVDIATNQQYALPFRATEALNVSVIDAPLFLVMLSSPRSLIDVRYVLYDHGQNQVSDELPQEQWRHVRDTVFASPEDDERRIASVHIYPYAVLVAYRDEAAAHVDYIVYTANLQTLVNDLPAIRSQLDAQQIPYNYDPSFDAPLGNARIGSPNGQYLVTRHGIQDQDTLELIQPVPAYFLHLTPKFEPRYWVAGGNAVLFTRSTATVGDLGPTIAAVIPWFAVRQPLLLLPVPQEMSLR